MCWDFTNFSQVSHNYIIHKYQLQHLCSQVGILIFSKVSQLYSTQISILYLYSQVGISHWYPKLHTQFNFTHHTRNHKKSYQCGSTYKWLITNVNIHSSFFQICQAPNILWLFSQFTEPHVEIKNMSLSETVYTPRCSPVSVSLHTSVHHTRNRSQHNHQK